MKNQESAREGMRDLRATDVGKMKHQDDERVILALSFLEPLVLNKENIEIAV